MVVGTRKYEYKMFHESRDISYGDKADFVIRGTSNKSSFKVVEMKKVAGRMGARQLSQYLRMPFITGDYHVLRTKTDIHYYEIFMRSGIQTLAELVRVARRIEISYPNQPLLETSLGTEEKRVLGQVLSVVSGLVQERDWPLNTIEVRYVRDPEVEDWEYVLLLLVFTCDFDSANTYLHELYDEIDVLTDKLRGEERRILQRMVFFDVETRASIPSA